MHASTILDRILVEISTNHGTPVNMTAVEREKAESLIQVLQDNGFFNEDDEDDMHDDIIAVAESDHEYFDCIDTIYDLIEVIDHGFYRGRA